MSLCNGPLHKNLYTQQLELIAKCLIQAPEKIQLHSTLDGQADGLVFTLDVGGNVINLSNLFQKVNFSHLYMSESDSQSYLRKYNLTTPAAIKSKCPQLTEAEKRTINAYSGCSEPFNAMLYGNKRFNHKKETIIDCVLLASGLNKIDSTTMYNLPDEMPNVLLPPLQTYRGEVYMTEDIVNSRKACVEQGGGITMQHGFMSTSCQQKVSRNFSKNSLIIFERLYGKDITELANDPREKEFLLPPSQIFWYDFKNDGQANIFYGRVVDPLNENAEEPTPEEIDTFRRLLQWAQRQGIKTDFLTDHLKHSLQLTYSASQLSLFRSEEDNSFEENRSPQVSNGFFRKLNSLIFSEHLYKTVFLMGMLSMASGTLFAQGMLFPVALGLACSTVALAFLTIRNRVYQKFSAQQQNRHLFQQNLPTPQKTAFENGHKAAHGWTPYFQSQFVATNWTHIREFATGYYEELNRFNTKSKRPL